MSRKGPGGILRVMMMMTITSIITGSVIVVKMTIRNMVTRPWPLLRWMR